MAAFSGLSPWPMIFLSLSFAVTAASRTPRLDICSRIVVPLKQRVVYHHVLLAAFFVEEEIACNAID